MGTGSGWRISASEEERLAILYSCPLLRSPQQTSFILEMNLQMRTQTQQAHTNTMIRTIKPTVAAPFSTLTVFVSSSSVGGTKVCSYDLATRAISRQKACRISSVVVSFGSSFVNSELDNVSSAVISETFSFPSLFNSLVTLYIAWSSYSLSGSSDTRVLFGDSTVWTSVQLTSM